MKIMRTGVQNYLPGGEAHMKTMVIGGPGVGKTRWSSGWPEPIYLDVEAGLSSVADQSVPYVEIGKDSSPSEDMLQALKWLKQSREARKYGTVVVDTFDAFQRKVKQEWLDNNPDAEAFSGYDAWGYLDGKMQMLMTRLLSLPMNVIVLVHYKDKTYSEKVGGTNVERHEYLLQLQGDIKDTAFNDFDLVGWMDTFWKPNPEGGGKIEVPGITFKRTPDKPFLKDRLNITPPWLEISLEGDDLEGNYKALFSRFIERLDDLKDGEQVGEIEDLPDDNAVDTSGVQGPQRGGPVAPQDPREMPLDQLKKAELIEMGRGMPAIADQVKTNLLKDELIALIEQARAKGADEADAEKAAAGDPEAGNENENTSDDDASQASEPEEKTESSTPVEAEAEPESAPEAPAEAPEEAEPEPEPEPEPTPEPEPEPVTEQGEAADTEEEQSEQSPEPAQQEEAEAEAPEHTCEECGKDLAGENKDYVKLAWIKYRQKLCNEHYIERKQKG